MNGWRVILGAICGLVATGPMTAVMVWWHRRLPASEKYPLPPREITGRVLEKAGVSATPLEMSEATLVAHFGYGAAAGALYGLLPSKKIHEPLRIGAGLGALVWIFSYFGLLPALNILRPATEHPARRNLLMLGAHLIWGACLSGLYHLLLEDAVRPAPALGGRRAPRSDT